MCIDYCLDYYNKSPTAANTAPAPTAATLAPLEAELAEPASEADADSDSDSAVSLPEDSDSVIDIDSVIDSVMDMDAEAATELDSSWSIAMDDDSACSMWSISMEEDPSWLPSWWASASEARARAAREKRMGKVTARDFQGGNHVLI